MEHQYGAKYCLSFPSTFSLLHINLRLLVALHYLCTVYSTSRTFSCLVSRNYYIKQMSNNNKMAFSQLPYQRSKTSCGHIMQRLYFPGDAAASPCTQDVVQEHGFATVALNSPKGHWISCERSPFSIKAQMALGGRGLNSQLCYKTLDDIRQVICSLQAAFLHWARAACKISCLVILIELGF